MNKESYHFAGDGRPAGRGRRLPPVKGLLRRQLAIPPPKGSPLSDGCSVKGGERPKRESNAAPLVGSVMVLLGTLLLLDDCHAPLGGKGS